jgi:Protein of unknown function (DUF3892)
MTEKWAADYLISAVRYNTAGTHIDRVRYHADNGDNIGSAAETSRQWVVDSLESGVTFVTIYQNPSDSTKWVRGAEVRVILIDGTKYIRTDADRTKRDNLGDLPRF